VYKKKKPKFILVVHHKETQISQYPHIRKGFDTNCVLLYVTFYI